MKTATPQHLNNESSLIFFELLVCEFPLCEKNYCGCFLANLASSGIKNTMAWAHCKKSREKICPFPSAVVTM